LKFLWWFVRGCFGGVGGGGGVGGWGQGFLPAAIGMAPGYLNTM